MSAQRANKFYHIKNLQSTKTQRRLAIVGDGFITLRIYKVLKPRAGYKPIEAVLSH